MSDATKTLAEIEEDLSKEIPPRFLKEKTKGGAKLTIFTWVTTQRFLSLYAPGWTSHNTVSLSNERVVVNCELCIPTSDSGLVCRDATGDDTEDDEDETPQEQRARQFGSPSTRAEGQAFKRAAARFGFGLYLRDKGTPAPQQMQAQPPQQRQAPVEAAPKPQQRSEIRSIYAPGEKPTVKVVPQTGEIIEGGPSVSLGAGYTKPKWDTTDGPMTDGGNEDDDIIFGPESAPEAPQATPQRKVGAGPGQISDAQKKAIINIGTKMLHLTEAEIDERTYGLFSLPLKDISKAQAGQIIDGFQEQIKTGRQP